MKYSTLESTLESKDIYEKLCVTNGISVKRYHADNGKFSDPAFRTAVSDTNQRIDFCGVVSHHQNGIVNRHIKDLTLITHTFLLHSKRRWLEMITNML